MKGILLAFTLSVTASGASGAEAQWISRLVEQLELACENYIASLGYPRSGSVYPHFKRMCMAYTVGDSDFVHRWLHKPDELSQALQACKAGLPSAYGRYGVTRDLRSCLALELKKLGRLTD